MKKSQPNLLLLSPSHAKAVKYFPSVQIDPEAHANLIAKIRRFRHQTYADEASLHQEDSITQAYADIDGDAWHLVAHDSTQEELLGCIRIFLFDLHQDRHSVEDLFLMGGVKFADANTRRLHIKVLQNHLADIQRTSRPCNYVGGLAVSRRGQQKGLGARLGLGAAAFCQIVHAPLGVTFAAARNGNVRFLQRVGGYPIDKDLSPFYCQEHRSEAQLLGLSVYTLNTRATQMMTTLAKYLREHPVLAAGV